MNFKFLFLFLSLIFILLTGCGVKANPVRYSETAIDSYIQTYTGKESKSEDLEKAKKSETLKTPISPTP